MAFESEKLLVERAGLGVEDYAQVDTSDMPQGEDKRALTRQRVNQHFFRQTVLCSYLYQCCISGITNTPLLEVCHILSWAENVGNRTNPKNGLCMNPLFHKACDNYLLAITPDYNVVVSGRMIEEAKEPLFRNYLKSIQGKKIILPEKFAPEQDYLDYRFQLYQEKQ